MFGTSTNLYCTRPHLEYISRQVGETLTECKSISRSHLIHARINEICSLIFLCKHTG